MNTFVILLFATMNLLATIKSLSEKYCQDVINFRRHFHINPELSYQEYSTVKYVAQQLRSFGIEPKEGIANTGLLAEIKGKNPKKTIALRADMDALPIFEANDVPYKSVNPGVMHACGHDVHTASLLGTAKILNEVKDQFDGTVYNIIYIYIYVYIYIYIECVQCCLEIS